MLLILAVIGSIFAIYKSVADRQIGNAVTILVWNICVVGMASWVPYLVARIIGWIVKGFIGKGEEAQRQEELNE